MISIIKLVLTLVITFFKGSLSKRSRPSNIAGMPHAKLLKYIEQSRVLLQYNYESDIILVVYIYIYIDCLILLAMYLVQAVLHNYAYTIW